MKTKNADAIYGNHEDLFVNGIVHRDTRIWLQNGGGATVGSYSKEDENGVLDCAVPAKIIEWLQTRQMYFSFDDLIISHAPITNLNLVPADPFGRDSFFIWNRVPPKKPQSKFMIYGHNGQFRRHKWGDGSEFAMCIDNSHSGRLTGIQWPSKEIFSVDYLDRHEDDSYLDIEAK